MISIKEYSEAVDRTAIHPNEIPEGSHPNIVGLLYCASKLCGEAGEVSEHIGKALRDGGGDFSPERITSIKKEMGDVMWYLARMCNLLDIKLEAVLHINIRKLESRKARGTLHGDGDDR